MINKALKLIRTYHDMSQTELCQTLGLSNSYLSEIESGKKQPTFDLLKRYSEAFDIPLSSIMFFSENLEERRPTDGLRKVLAKKIINILEWTEERNNAKEKRSA